MDPIRELCRLCCQDFSRRYVFLENIQGKVVIPTLIGINAITGKPRDKASPSASTQDYLSLPRQPWLDGICTASGVVRQVSLDLVLEYSLRINNGMQFVAMPLGHGYTIEEQMTGEAKEGGIQIDVFPTLSTSVQFMDAKGMEQDMGKTPRELCIVEGARIEMLLKFVAFSPQSKKTAHGICSDRM